MHTTHVSNIGSPFYPSLLTRYIDGVFSVFTHKDPRIEEISAYAQQRVFSHEKRMILVEVLQQQYAAIASSTASADNILALGDKDTFTITTGQQVHILGGPLFLITKIMDVIALAKQMNEMDEGKRYIPVFWLASEDHDWEEVNHVTVYGETYTCTVDTPVGPVGRYTPEGIHEVLTTLRERLDPSDENTKYLDLFEQAYTRYPTLAQATQWFLDQLFGDQGLIVLDADDPTLKQLFVQTMQQDLFAQASYTPLVEQTELLLQAGGEQQAIPKEINLFYMTDTMRARIEYTGDQYILVGTEMMFSEDEMRQEMHEHPERFSPNVFLRPLYQETILPNLAYLGGPGEIKYRLQMKQLFTTYDLQMPVLLPRQLIQYLSEKNGRKITESPLPLAERFVDYDLFIERLLQVIGSDYAPLKERLLQWQEEVHAVDAALANNHTGDKQITKALKNISEELTTIERRLSLGEKHLLEESVVYNGLLKLHKKFFDSHHRFEREQYVIGQTTIVDQLLQTPWTYAVGGIRVVVT